MASLWSPKACFRDVDWPLRIGPKPAPSRCRILALRRTPSSLPVAGLDRGVLRQVPVGFCGESSTTRHDLRLVFEAIPSSRAPNGAASHEVSCIRPSFDNLCCVHSRYAREAVTSALGCHAKRRVAPLWFPTTSTLFSAAESQRYCTPEPKGVRYVSRLALSSLPFTPKRSCSYGLRPRRRFPQRSCPSKGILTDSRATSPQPLPS
jgi:hypothetical protein